MATSTTNYNLIKPDGTDTYNIANANTNMDTIDGQMKTNATSIGTLASLTTTEKTNVVGAVNEIDTSVTNIETKTDFIAVTQAVDLDTMESDIVTNLEAIQFNDLYGGI